MHGYEWGMTLRPPPTHYPLDFNHAHSTVSLGRGRLLSYWFCSVSPGQIAGWCVHRVLDGLADCLQQETDSGPKAGGPRLKHEIHNAQSVWFPKPRWVSHTSRHVTSPVINPSGGSDQYTNRSPQTWRVVSCEMTVTSWVLAAGNRWNNIRHCHAKRLGKHMINEWMNEKLLFILKCFNQMKTADSERNFPTPSRLHQSFF